MKILDYKLNDIIVYASSLFLAFSYIVSELYMLCVVFIIFRLCVSITLGLRRKFSTSESNFLIVAFMCLFLIIPAIIFKELNFEYIKHAICLIGMVCLGFYLSELKPIKLLWSRLPFFCLVIFFLTLHSQGVASRDFLQSNSENFVSVSLFLSLFLSFALSKVYRVDYTALVMVLLTFYLSLICIGRAGIITSAFIFASFLAIFLYTEVSKVKSILFKLIVSFVVVLLSFSLLIYLINFIVDSGMVDRLLSRGLTDYSRSFIIDVYLGEVVNFKHFLFGVDYYALTLLEKYNYNLHNSYLSIHALFGAMFFLCYFCIIFWAGVRLFLSYNFALLIPFVAILVRAITDIQILGGKLDWIFFFAFFISLKKTQGVSADK